MNGYSVPEQIRSMKPKGTAVKAIGGHYYVYMQKHVKDTSTGKWKIKTGRMIGKIDPSLGFVTNEEPTDEITIVEYGQYHLAFEVGRPVLSRLEEFFGAERAHQVYLMAVMDYVNGYTATRDLNDTFLQSCLSVSFPSLSFSEDRVRGILADLGRRTGKPDAFTQSLIDSSREIAVDGHAVACQSESNSLADFGTKYNRLGSRQMNVLCAYDTQKNCPVYSDLFEGSMVDSQSVREMMNRYLFKDKLFLVDSGFYSSENLRLFSQNGCHYVIPLRKNFRDCMEVMSKPGFDGEFVYRKSGKSGTIIRYKTLDKDGCRIVALRDEGGNLNDRISYEEELSKGTKGYSKEDYESLKEAFSTIVLRTDMAEKSPREIYEDYKRRWRVETYFDHLKNNYGFKALWQSDYYVLRGLSFIALIEGMIHSEMMKRKKEAGGMTENEILVLASYLKAKKEKGVWLVANAKKKVRDLYQCIGLEIPSSIPVPCQK